MVGQASCLPFLRKETTSVETPELETYRRRLRHWRLEGSIYFVTWRLAKGQPPMNPEERALIACAIRHFDGERYELLAYVVMDDHVHVMALPVSNQSLSQILHSWKSFTAKGLRKLGERVVPVWQDEYFDREFARIRGTNSGDTILIFRERLTGLSDLVFGAASGDPKQPRVARGSHHFLTACRCVRADEALRTPALSTRPTERSPSLPPTPEEASPLPTHYPAQSNERPHCSKDRPRAT
jgi:putative transposase